MSFSYSDDKISELTKRLQQETGKQYTFIKEYHVFGTYPSFKTENKKDPIMYVCWSEDQGYFFRTATEMLEYLEAHWRPAGQYEQDWFCSRMRQYFNS